ncbi:hypothetical protein Hanom_Chr08g00738691 [Helianthus anomalus]
MSYTPLRGGGDPIFIKFKRKRRCSGKNNVRQNPVDIGSVHYGFHTRYSKQKTKVKKIKS